MGPDGRRSVETFEAQAAAEAAKRALQRKAPGRVTLDQTIDRYMQHQRAKGNKASSIERTERRLRAFHDLDQSVADVTLAMVTAWYKARSAKLAADSHRNELNEAKTFWRWCVHSGLVAKSPAEGVEPQGRRHRGKLQLRRAEARTLFVEAHRQAVEGDDGALAVLALLLLGTRSGELLCRCVRDVDVGADQEGVLLWVDAGKTESARRCIEVPEPVAGLLAARVRNQPPSGWLFPASTSTGHRRLEWAIDATRRLCLAAGVPVVCPHGLRGTWATMAREAGLATQVVARELGHASDQVTKRHYLAPGADDAARTRTALRVITGGAAQGMGNDCPSNRFPQDPDESTRGKTVAGTS